MNTVRLNAYAKLNLTLDITGSGGGYHMLDSLVTTVDLFDKIVVKKRRDKLVSVTMHGMGSEEILPEHNNAQRAGEAFVNAFCTAGADITIYKNIPIGAGMGGSSADISGVILALSRLYGVEDFAAVKALADSLGSDTGYLLSGGLARIRGRGEEVEPLPFEDFHFLVLCPKSGVSTKECYARFDEVGSGFSPCTQEALNALSAGNAGWAARYFHNALERAASGLCPAIEEAVFALKSLSSLGVGMTGSGSAVFSVFETSELCAWAKSRYRGNARAYVLKSVDPAKISSFKNPYEV